MFVLKMLNHAHQYSKKVENIVELLNLLRWQYLNNVLKSVKIQLNLRLILIMEMVVLMNKVVVKNYYGINKIKIQINVLLLANVMN